MYEKETDRGYGAALRGERERTRVANAREPGDEGKRAVEEMNSLVSLLLVAEKRLSQIQLLPNRITQDTKS